MNSKNFYHTWNYIEKRAFTPADQKETRRWLRCFGMLFNKLFEKKEKFPKPKNKNSNKFEDKLNVDLLNVTIEYRIENNRSKFSISIDWQGGKLQFDYLNEHCAELNDKFNLNQLRALLENKIRHPAIHCHIKDPLPHDIRIGTATNNPFLFLYQLIFQFLCIFGNNGKKNHKQEKELERLTRTIFASKPQMSISPGKLFDQ